MPINLADLSNSPYLVSNDYKVGTVLPVVEIERVVMEDVPVPNSTKKNRKAIIYFVRAKKGWAVNTNVARRIGGILGETKAIETTWIGAKLQIEVVGDVRRPDGSRGNAFRLKDAWKKGDGPAVAKGGGDPTAPEPTAAPVDGPAPAPAPATSGGAA